MHGYDPNGNRTSLTSTPPGGPTTVAGYTYDDADQLTSDGSLSYGYDASGNLTAAGPDGFGWDWVGRMRTATVGGTTTSYAWDGDGVRTGTTSGGTTTPWVWDRAGGLPRLVGDGNDAYLHAGGVVAEVDASDAAAYALTDGLGSVRARSDASGRGCPASGG